MQTSLKGLVEWLSQITSLVPLLRTADANGTGVDLQFYEGATIIFMVGAADDTIDGSNFIEAQLEESVDNSVWTDVAGEDMIGAVALATDANGTFALINAAGEVSKSYKVGYKGNKRYIRVVDQRTGTHTNGTTTSAIVLRHAPRRFPTVDTPGA